MEAPTSIRLGKAGEKLKEVCRTTGLKKPDVIKLALAELFKTHTKSDTLVKAVLTHRAKTEAA